MIKNLFTNIIVDTITFYFLCIVIDCGSLTHPANGDVLVLSTIFNSVAMYSCNAGYNLTGDTTRTCLGTGFWSGSEANCTGKNYIYTLMCYNNDNNNNNDDDDDLL